MPGKEHALIAEQAVRFLPDWQQAYIAAERKRLIETCCSLPDLYFDLEGGGHELAVPYYFETDGIQFHYIPDTPIVPLYRYWTVDRVSRKLRLLLPYENLNWHHAARGFVHYVSRSVASFRSGNLQDGCAFAGCLLHFLQDCAFGGHSLEGPNGTDIFVLQRLFPESADVRMDPFEILFESPPPAFQTEDYIPSLLGFTPEEIAFQLYSRYARVTAQARRICHAIIVNMHEGRADRNTALYQAMFMNAAYLCADTLYTILCAANRRCETAAVHLLKVALSDMEPVQRPWLTSAPYRSAAILRDSALDGARARIPLQLVLADGEAPVTFAKGLGMGAHVEYTIAYELPAGVYRAFECALGLHAMFYREGDVRITLRQDGQTRYAARFYRDHPGARLRLENPAGRFELMVETERGLGNPNNNIVWGAPILERQAPEWM